MRSVGSERSERQLARAEDLEPTEGRQPARTCRSEQSERQLELYLRVEPGAVDDRAACLCVSARRQVWVGAAWLCNLHLLDGEGAIIAD